MDNNYHCQIAEDTYGKPICNTQCEMCKNAKITIKQHKDAKTKKNRKRYYLHNKIKKQGYKFNPASYTIYVPIGNTKFSKDVNKLVNNFGYCIQTEIPIA